MVYIALLRGINVGGKSLVSMAELKRCFESLGFERVRTYINSGNVIFSTESLSVTGLARRIEAALDQTFDPGIRVLVKTRESLRSLAAAIPSDWVNDTTTRCDVMFLWPAVDSPEVLRAIPTKPELETIRYIPGAVVWYIDRAHVRKSRMTRLIGTPTYAQMTLRNLTTVRKLVALTNEVD